MQEQDSWGGLGAGFTIEDVQFIDTNSIVMHWMLRRDEWAVCWHFSYLVVIDFYLVWIFKEYCHDFYVVDAFRVQASRAAS